MKRFAYFPQSVFVVLLGLGFCFAPTGAPVLGNPPPVTAGLVAHYDASALGGLSDGDRVNFWEDQSGNENHATNSDVPEKQPVYRTDAINGLPAIQFLSDPPSEVEVGSEIETYLDMPDMVEWGSFDWVIVAKYNRTNDNPDDMYIVRSDCPDGRRFRIGVITEGRYYYRLIDPEVNVDNVTDTNFHIHEVYTSNEAAHNFVVVLDGTEQGARTLEIPDDPLLCDVDLGHNPDNRNDPTRFDPLDGLIAEVLVYNRPLTEEERNAVGFCLGEKYGLATSSTDPGTCVAPLLLKADVGAECDRCDPACPTEEGWFPIPSAGSFANVNGTGINLTVAIPQASAGCRTNQVDPPWPMLNNMFSNLLFPNNAPDEAASFIDLTIENLWPGEPAVVRSYHDRENNGNIITVTVEGASDVDVPDQYVQDDDSLNNPLVVSFIAGDGPVKITYQGLAREGSYLNGFELFGTGTAPPMGLGPFIRGDCNFDQEPLDPGSTTDAVFLLNYLAGTGPVPPCLAACNVNADEFVDERDSVFLLKHLFEDGPPPPSPFPIAGTSTDPVDLSMGCEVPLPGIGPFVRGDCNGNGVSEGDYESDAAAILAFLNVGAANPPCLVACDANADGSVNNGDALYLLAIASGSGPPPPAPWPLAGMSEDPNDGALGCSAPLAPVGRFVRGDCNGNGASEGDAVSDAIAVFAFQFLGEFDPPCLVACDANVDKFVDVSDGIYILEAGLTGGDPPPPPWPTSGLSLHPDDLTLGCDGPLSP